jgi:predicted Holliday junction resolvase-like endonuclease
MQSTYIKIILGLIGLSIILFLLWRRSVKQLKETKFAKTSLSTKYGKMTEQFMPFLADYPYDPQSFRFLGTPIDGVQFTPEGVVFIEFKAASSQLSSIQRQIRDMIKEKKVDFKVIRI